MKIELNFSLFGLQVHIALEVAEKDDQSTPDVIEQYECHSKYERQPNYMD